MRNLFGALTPLLIPLVVVIACASADASGWKSGTAKQKITPQDALWMAGYASRTHPATGVLNDLWAKTLVIEDEHGSRAAIITLDLIGIGPDLAAPICALLESKYQLPRSKVVIFCSHTHSGPVLGRAARTMHYDQVDDAQRQLIDRYAAELQKTAVDLVGRAVGALAESQLSWGTGQATFAVNRRNNKEPDAPKLREAGQLLGPIDHDVPVLAIRDAAGKLTAVLFGYACHATVLGGYDWSSDYPGFAQSELEELHPGCTALFFAGCGGDQNPLPRRKVEYARQYGRDLALAVDAVLKKPLEPLAATLQTAYLETPLDLAKVPTREELEQDTQANDRFIATRARMYLDRLSAGTPVPASYSYPIQAWRLGDTLTLVALGGEVVVDYSLRIKHELSPERTWVAGYSNDVMGYIPSRRVLTEGGYEGGGAMIYYGLPSPWAPTVEQRVVDGVHAVVKQLK